MSSRTNLASEISASGHANSHVHVVPITIELSRGHRVAEVAVVVLGVAFLAGRYTVGAPVLAPADKLIPLALVAGGALVGWALSRLKVGFLRRIWDLTPSYQALAQGGEGMRALRVLDEGAGEALSGPG